MLALASTSSPGRWSTSARPAALAAFVAAQPALLFGYALWGGVKELAIAAHAGADRRRGPPAALEGWRLAIARCCRWPQRPLRVPLLNLGGGGSGSLRFCWAPVAVAGFRLGGAGPFALSRRRSRRWSSLSRCPRW